MERELLQSDYSSNEQPHFDEEWTLMTARPVVPLNEIAKTGSNRRKVRLVASFGAALVLGVLSALVVASFERSRVAAISSAEQEPEQQELTLVSKPEVAASEEPKGAETGVPVEAPVISAPKTLAVVREKTKTPERQGGSARASTTEKQPDESETESANQPRAQLFAEFQGRWEERRARRVRRQERRERSGRRGRDLLRIDEIFEGPRP